MKIASPGPDGCVPKYSESNLSELRANPSYIGTGVPVLTNGPEYVEMPITLQAATDQAIVVTGMSVNVTSSEAVPTRGSIIKTTGCGGGVDERLYEVTPPAVASSVQPRIEGTGANGVGFPYKVTSGDPEQLTVRLNPVDRDIWFTVTVTWVSGGEIHTSNLDNNGRGYRVMGAGKLPQYTEKDLYH
ncbi:hypothetical protein OG586_35185 [Streptomyces murinus]|uniref:hypothetical protein n=1 Tax=Streptomyces murinus TaxID=33900 RepID=UPI002E809567|nr:hypothetical protein [Streptomyces murinus]WUD11943.1 hypothetical protein OG586_35185 [Streptomyces murinus]